MALEEFEKEELSARDKNLVRMRSMTNYVMGIFFIAAGFFFMFPNEYLLKRYDASTMKMFAVICWVYGLFRLFRGV
ncbi:MAG: hypothetical protein WDM90_17625 [Ferruginibacter sp.]